MAIKTEQEYLEWKKNISQKELSKKLKPKDEERNKPNVCESCQ